jgi:hypothetical protein
VLFGVVWHVSVDRWSCLPDRDSNHHPCSFSSALSHCSSTMARSECEYVGWTVQPCRVLAHFKVVTCQFQLVLLWDLSHHPRRCDEGVSQTTETDYTPKALISMLEGMPSVLQWRWFAMGPGPVSMPEQSSLRPWHLHGAATTSTYYSQYHHYTSNPSPEPHSISPPQSGNC